jgi:teichuronic acid biosynthesis glycosyltransferase TuaG
MDLISIIIPYYKKKIFIQKTINSILNQTYKNFEILIIYDDTNRSDLKIINKIKKKDKRIRLIINKKNIGAGQSRNKGIKNSKGKYISFIDADDLWNKNKLKEQLNFMKSKQKLISHTSYKIIDKKNNFLGIRRSKNIYEFKKLLLSCDIGLSTVMIDKSIMKNKFQFPSTKTKEDFILWLNIVRSGINIYSIDKVLTYWRKTDHSLSSSTLQKIKDGFTVYKKYMRFNIFLSIYYLSMLSINFLIKNYINK